MITYFFDRSWLGRSVGHQFPFIQVAKMIKKSFGSLLSGRFLVGYLMLAVGMGSSCWASSADEMKSTYLSLVNFDHSAHLLTVVDSAVHNELPHYQSVEMEQRIATAKMMQILQQADKPMALFVERQFQQRVLHLVFFERVERETQSESAEGSTMLRARRVLSEVIFSRDLSTLDSIELIWNAEQSSRVQLGFTQTSLPDENDRNFMPGPPLRFYFYYDEQLEQYRRHKD